MAFDLFRKTPVHTAIVVDEFGALQGLVIRTDLLEMVAGDLPRSTPRPGPISRSARTALTSSMPLYPSPIAMRLVGISEAPFDDYVTLAGFIRRSCMNCRSRR